MNMLHNEWNPGKTLTVAPCPGDVQTYEKVIKNCEQGYKCLGLRRSSSINLKVRCQLIYTPKNSGIWPVLTDVAESVARLSQGYVDIFSCHLWMLFCDSQWCPCIPGFPTKLIILKMFGASILEQYPTKTDVSPMIYEIIVLFFDHKNKLFLSCLYHFPQF